MATSSIDGDTFTAPDTVQDTVATDEPGPGFTLWPPKLLRVRTGRELALLATRFPVGLFWFIVIVTLLALGLGTLVIMVGAAVVAILLVITRAGAGLERQLLGFVDGRPIASPYRPIPPGGGVLAVAKRWLTDGATYRDLLYLFLQFPLGLGSFLLLVLLFVVPVGLVLLPTFYWAVPDGVAFVFRDGNAELVVDRLWEAMIASAVGLVLLSITPYVLSWIATAHIWLGRGLLGPSPAAALLAKADEGRRRGVSASLIERKRIERDLHDGVQQQLVSVAMNLGRAKAKFDHDPDGARELVDIAHQQTKTAISDLRNLARGIMPAVLTDRGIDAALSALAQQSPLAVRVTTDVSRRLPESVESTAYFVVAEALTNAAKHGGGGIRIAVNVRDTGETLQVEISDDGPGGADPEGPGLLGLADRLASIGGRLWVADGVVSGTIIRAELPCVS